jgi:hypothetical protein
VVQGRSRQGQDYFGSQKKRSCKRKNWSRDGGILIRPTDLTLCGGASVLVNCGLFSLVVPRSPEYQGVEAQQPWNSDALPFSRIANSDQHERPTVAQ